MAAMSSGRNGWARGSRAGYMPTTASSSSWDGVMAATEEEEEEEVEEKASRCQSSKGTKSTQPHHSGGQPNTMLTTMTAPAKATW